MLLGVSDFGGSSFLHLWYGDLSMPDGYNGDSHPVSTEGIQQPLKKNYTYVLIDPRTDSVFYVGKGTGTRLEQHEREADHVDNPKTRRINAIKAEGLKHIELVVARFDDDREALAAEAVLIHWVYGISNLTNIQRGHGCAYIRPHGNLGPLEDLDVPRKSTERVVDGRYTAHLAARNEARGVFDRLDEFRSLLLSRHPEWIDHVSVINRSAPNNPSLYIELCRCVRIDILLRRNKDNMVRTWLRSRKGSDNRVLFAKMVEHLEAEGKTDGLKMPNSDSYCGILADSSQIRIQSSDELFARIGRLWALVEMNCFCGDHNN